MRRASAVALMSGVVLATIGGAAVIGLGAGAEVRSVKPTGSITVFAASSLTDAFTTLGHDFEHSHPGTTITFSFNASSTLATQIEERASADVFASADDANMARLVDAGAISGAPVAFASNRLEIAVEPGNPLEIHSLADTIEDDVILVLCAAVVPCGAYALESYTKAGVQLPEVPTAENARAAITKVELGEADAAVAYVTDVVAAQDDVQGVPIPKRDNVVASYPIGIVKEGEHRALAKAFTDYVMSARGQRTLQRFGFLAP